MSHKAMTTGGKIGKPGLPRIDSLPPLSIIDHASGTYVVLDSKDLTELKREVLIMLISGSNAGELYSVMPWTKVVHHPDKRLTIGHDLIPEVPD